MSYCDPVRQMSKSQRISEVFFISVLVETNVLVDAQGACSRVCDEKRDTACTPISFAMHRDKCMIFLNDVATHKSRLV